MKTNLRTLSRHIIVITFYALLAAIALYWPLAHTATHLPGNPTQTDYFHFHWSYWWIGHALSTPGLDVFHTDYVMAPFSTNLAYHTMSPIWYPLWALLEPPFGTVAAMNTIVLTALTLTGYSLYALLRVERVPPGLSLLGGAIFMLAPPLLLAIYMTTVHYLGFFWLPVLLLLWRQVARHGHSWRAGPFWAALMGFALYLTLMTDYQYFLYGALIIVPYGLLTLYQGAAWRLVALGGLSLVLMGVLAWVAGPLPALLEFDRDSLAGTPAESVYSIPFIDGLIRRYDYDANTIATGALLLPLLVASVARMTLSGQKMAMHKDRMATNATLGHAQNSFWLVITLVLLVLALGTQVQINSTTITLPYGWLHEPLGGLFRSPGRFAMAAFVPGLIFIGRAWRDLAGHWQWLAVPVLLVLVALEARIYTPFPMQPQPPAYAFYNVISAENLDYVVIEVPTAAGTGETWVGDIRDLALQFYGITHQKRMVNGLIARAPISHFWYLRTEAALLSWLGQRVAFTPQAEGDLRAMIDEYPVGYVVVHQEHIGLETTANQEVIGWLNGTHGLLCPAYVEGAAVAYRTSWHPAGCAPRIPPEIAPGVYQINVGALEDAPYLGWGWHWREVVAGLDVRWTGDWAQLIFGIEDWLPGSQHRAQVFADLPPGNYVIEIDVQALERTRTLEVIANGRTLESVDVSPDGLSTLRFDLPIDAINPMDVDAFTLVYDGADVPGGGDDPQARRLALMVDAIRFVQVSE